MGCKDQRCGKLKIRKGCFFENDICKLLLKVGCNGENMYTSLSLSLSVYIYISILHGKQNSDIFQLLTSAMVLDSASTRLGYQL